jgi:hypothetical protein
MTHWQGASLLFLILSMYSFTLAHGIQVVMTSTMCQNVQHLNTKSTISKLEHNIQYLYIYISHNLFGFYMHYQGLCFYKDYNIFVIIIIYITISKLQMSCNTFMDLLLFCLKINLKMKEKDLMLFKSLALQFKCLTLKWGLRSLRTQNLQP